MINRSLVNKIFVGFCLTFLLTTLIGSIICFADEVIQSNSLYNSSLLKKSNGVVSLVSQSNRNTSYLDMTSYGAGNLTVTMDSAGYGAVLVSQDDMPQDIEIGYTFISTDFHSINNVASITVHITGNCYVFISYNKTCTATFEPDNIEPTLSPNPTPTDEPTPSISPAPTPTDISIRQGIPYHFDIPLDYYLILIIVILGGIVICLLFRN